jgi:hypothetical protein
MTARVKARYTAQMAVAVEPEMKEEVEAAGEARGVDKSTVARWALREWLDRNTKGAVR